MLLSRLLAANRAFMITAEVDLEARITRYFVCPTLRFSTFTPRKWRISFQLPTWLKTAKKRLIEFHLLKFLVVFQQLLKTSYYKEAASSQGIFHKIGKCLSICSRHADKSSSCIAKLSGELLWLISISWNENQNSLLISKTVECYHQTPWSYPWIIKHLSSLRLHAFRQRIRFKSGLH